MSIRPITLSTALCLPTSSAGSTSVPSLENKPAACRPPVSSKTVCEAPCFRQGQNHRRRDDEVRGERRHVHRQGFERLPPAQPARRIGRHIPTFAEHAVERRDRITDERHIDDIRGTRPVAHGPPKGGPHVLIWCGSSCLLVGSGFSRTFPVASGFSRTIPICAVCNRAEVVGRVNDALGQQESGRELTIGAGGPHDDGKRPCRAGGFRAAPRSPPDPAADVAMPAAARAKR